MGDADPPHRVVDVVDEIVDRDLLRLRVSVSETRKRR